MSRHAYTRSATDISPKVAASAAAGAIGILIVYLVGLFTTVQIPSEVEAAVVVLVSAAFGYSTRDRI